MYTSWDITKNFNGIDSIKVNTSYSNAQVYIHDKNECYKKLDESMIIWRNFWSQGKKGNLLFLENAV